MGTDAEAVWAEIEAVYRGSFAQFERVARAITGDGESAREAVQDGFADALRHADQYTAAGPLEGWVWRCVVNRARKARPGVTYRLQEARAVNGHDSLDDEGLRARIASLPERQRLVVFLRYYADLGYREIAAALGIEVGTVSATLNAAHSSLRTSMLEVHG